MVFVIQELIFLNVFSMGVIALVGILLVPIYLKFYLDYILFQKLRSGSSGYVPGVVAWTMLHGSVVVWPLDMFISQLVTDWIKMSCGNAALIRYHARYVTRWSRPKVLCHEMEGRVFEPRNHSDLWLMRKSVCSI